MAEKTTETAMTQVAPTALVKPDYGIDVARVLAMRAAVEQVIKEVLREGEHYGEIPGTTKQGEKPKKALKQSGAEVLCQVFRMRPQPEEVTVIERDDFIFLKIRCKLYNSVTGELMGEALASCNSREDKYVKQTAYRLCPSCKMPTIFRSKKRPGDTSTTNPGWFCWSKKGGCGAEFAYEDKAVIDQTGSLNSNKVWGLHHTILSMAQKRAYVRATRNATGTSDIFTDEDVPPDEDDDHGQGGTAHQRTQSKPTTAPKATVIQVRDLNAALMGQQIGTAVPTGTSEEEAKEIGRGARMSWVNQMLEDEEMAKVAGMSELSPDIADRLIAAAKSGKMPKGW